MRYGWKRDRPDHRDYKLGAPAPGLPAPPTWDLTPHMPPIWDQGKTSSCTAHATAAALQHAANRITPPSRMFIYYTTRVIEGDVDKDDGAEIRDAVKAVSSLGACDESVWPFDTENLFQKPNRWAYNNAATLANYARTYLRVTQTVDALRSAISSGYPVIFGFNVPRSFESNAVAQSGIMPMPGPNDYTPEGHAVLAVGYESDYFIIRNRWGDSRGKHGYFRMPRDFISDPSCASDF